MSNYVTRMNMGEMDPGDRFRADQNEAWAMEGVDLMVRMTAAHIVSEHCDDSMCMPDAVFDVLVGRTPAQLEGLLLYTIRKLTEVMLADGRLIRVDGGE